LMTSVAPSGSAVSRNFEPSTDVVEADVVVVGVCREQPTTISNATHAARETNFFISISCFC
jgi:hypothetical protein